MSIEYGYQFRARSCSLELDRGDAPAAARAARGRPARGRPLRAPGRRTRGCRPRARSPPTSASRGGWSSTPTRSCSPRATWSRAAAPARSSPRPPRAPSAPAAEPPTSDAARSTSSPATPTSPPSRGGRGCARCARCSRRRRDRALGYPDPRGAPELRRALAGHLRRVRGVVADPQTIVVCSGAAQGSCCSRARSAARTSRSRTPACRPTARSSPRTARGCAALAGRRATARASASCARSKRGAAPVDAVLVTPAHQSPTGVALAPRAPRGAARLGGRDGAGS